jgi:hypothetical protein
MAAEKAMRANASGGNRSFGLLLAGFFLILGALSYYRHGSSWPAWAAVALVFLVISLWMPRILGPLQRCWLRLAGYLARFVNPVVLSILYAAIIVPIGGLMRLFGKDPLAMRRDAAAASYWVARTGGGLRRDRLNEQF